jgi:hypothetical protein
MCPSAAARLPTQQKVGMMHHQEVVCPKDGEFYVMGTHLKHKKPHSFLYPIHIYILHTLYKEFKHYRKY